MGLEFCLSCGLPRFGMCFLLSVPTDRQQYWLSNCNQYWQHLVHISQYHFTYKQWYYAWCLQSADTNSPFLHIHWTLWLILLFYTPSKLVGSSVELGSKSGFTRQININCPSGAEVQNNPCKEDYRTVQSISLIDPMKTNKKPLINCHQQRQEDLGSQRNRWMASSSAGGYSQQRHTPIETNKQRRALLWQQCQQKVW